MVEATSRPPVPADRVTDDELIANYIVQDPGMGPDAARTTWGVPVWILIGDLRGDDASVEATAAAYELPTIAVDAALAYYRKRRDVIEARLLLNDAAFE